MDEAIVVLLTIFMVLGLLGLITFAIAGWNRNTPWYSAVSAFVISGLGGMFSPLILSPLLEVIFNWTDADIGDILLTVLFLWIFSSIALGFVATRPLRKLTPLDRVPKPEKKPKPVA